MMTDYSVEQPRYRIMAAQQSKFGWKFSLFCNQLFNPYFASSLNHFHSVTTRISKREAMLAPTLTPESDQSEGRGVFFANGITNTCKN